MPGFPKHLLKLYLKSIHLGPGAVVFDPWNGSGTTTRAASRLGLPSLGFDLNPVMIVVALARLLPFSEASSLVPLRREIVKRSRQVTAITENGDPLLQWFTPASVGAIGSIERAIRHILLGLPPAGDGSLRSTIDLSRIAATYYLGLFFVCRALTAPFRCSNPTWLRVPRDPTERLTIRRADVEKLFIEAVSRLAETLVARGRDGDAACANAEVRLADATSSVAEAQADIILTSPPYCTRIDYPAATRIELALLSKLMPVQIEVLSRAMTGTTRVPRHQITPLDEWGSKCLAFLDAVSQHPSKASKEYYFRTHLDYFHKMFRSLRSIEKSLRSGGVAILVV
jgi:DNA methylase